MGFQDKWFNHKKSKMLTSILPSTGFVPKTDVSLGEARTKSKFKTPFTLETVFGLDPGLDDLTLFTMNRGVNFNTLSEEDKRLWKRSWRENRVLCGYLVFAVVFPAYLKRRIKLRDAETHWVNIDDSTLKGKSKLEWRKKSLEIVESMTASSCFRGTSDLIHPGVLARDFLGLNKTDEGFLFFTQRDFARTSKNSSAHASCAAMLSNLWFVTTVLGRPCSLDSVVVPIRGEEMSRLTHLGISGKVTAFPVDWQADVFNKLPGYSHEKIAGLFLERLTSDSYVEMCPSDVFLMFKARMKGDSEKVNPGAKSSAYNLVVVPCFDTLLSQTDTCQIDALDISAIALDFGEEAARQVKSTESVGVFSASMGLKMNETIKFFSEKHLLVRRFVNNSLKIKQAQDPGGIKKKLAGGRLLDPRVGVNVDAVKDMIEQISARTWTPIKNVLFRLVDELNPGMDDETMCKAFLSVGYDWNFQKRAKNLGVSMVDVSNVCFLLCLTMSFQRSQVLRDSTVREYIPTRNGVGYTLSIERAVKTTGASVDGYAPVREFELTSSQSMMIHFIKIVGNRGGNQRLLVNERGGDMTQSNLGFRYRTIGKAYLNIPNLSPHCMRTFFASHVVDSGLITESEMNEMGSFLQVSAKTLRTAYVASSTNTASHKVGKRALGFVMDSASKSNKIPRPAANFDVESRPKGRQLAKSRDVYKESILASVSRHKDAKECFKALVDRRREGCLGEKDQWFEFRNSFFSDDDGKFFVRFVQSRLVNS